MPPPVQELPAPPPGRVLVAFNATKALTWSPTWTRLDSYPNLVTSYTIDRGRQYELDRTDVGRAVVEIADPTGILDPTNLDGPFYGKIEPLLQVMLGRRNPVTGTWHTRFRGWIEDLAYDYDPSQQVSRLTITLVDIFEMLAAIDMHPGVFGNKPPAGHPDARELVWFEPKAEVRDRMAQVLGNAQIPVSFYVLFSGNVSLFEGRYSPGENPLTVIQEAAESEFPGVGNIYTDRYGRLVFHGRLAKFTPDTIYNGLTLPYRWDYHAWKAGDRAAVDFEPENCAQIREFAYDRGLSKIVNSASASPMWSNAKADTPAGTGNDLTPAEVNGQLVTHTVSADGQTVIAGSSIDKYGFRSWSADNLLTERGQPSGANSLKETKKFATYYVDNYREPRNRVSAIGFRSINPVTSGAAINWELLSKVDISDSITITVTAPGSSEPGTGGFVDEPFFVEGVHEEVRPLGTDQYDDVTVRLDLSPRAYYATFPP